MAFTEHTPAYKSFVLNAQVVTNDVECLSLIVQILKLYPDVDRAWIRRCLDVKE